MNIINQPGTVHSSRRRYWGNSGENTGGYTQYYYGSEPVSYDGNASTFYGISQLASGKDREFGACSVEVTHTWPTPITLGEVSAKIWSESNAYTGNYANRGTNPQINQKIELYLNGSWTTVWSYTDPYYPGDAQNNETKLSTPYVEGTWTLCTGLRITSYAASYTYEGGRTSRTWAFIYDVAASPTDIVVKPDTLQMTGSAWGPFSFSWTVEISDPLALVVQHDGVILPLVVDLSDAQWIAVDVWSNQYMNIPVVWPFNDPSSLTPDGLLELNLIKTGGNVYRIPIEVRTQSQWDTHYHWVGDLDQRVTTVYVIAIPAGPGVLELYVGSLRTVHVKAVSFNVIYPDRELNTGYSYTNPWGAATYLDLIGDLTLNLPTLSISSTEIVEAPLNIEQRILDNTFNNRTVYPKTLDLGIYALAPGDILLHPDTEELHIEYVKDAFTWQQLTSLDLTVNLNESDTAVVQENDLAGFFAMGVTLNTPGTLSTSGTVQVLQLNSAIVVDPHTGVGATIVRYIWDPVSTAGCPMCGTFLYKKNGRSLTSGMVTSGRNFEAAIDDTYTRCGKCGFLVKNSRHTAHHDGDRSGWGITYVEIRADA